MLASRKEGFSLIEVMVTLVVLAIGLAMAFPNWEQSTQKRRLTSSAEQLAAFLSEAQGSAIKHNSELTVSLQHVSATEWCLGAVLGGTACDCTVTDTTNASFCAIDGAPQVLEQSLFGTTEMPAHSTDTTFTFEPIRGIMANADLGNAHSYDLVSENDQFALQVNVLPTGRIRVCGYDSDKKVPGFADCPVEAVEDPDDGGFGF
ncbi:MAG TPA: GspH/FimT family pseudopilin [Xanthomonadales bacterium]|nr:GspH/FimT family pseudopilin [Xanthomonadales bacterium]